MAPSCRPALFGRTITSLAVLPRRNRGLVVLSKIDNPLPNKRGLRVNDVEGVGLIRLIGVIRPIGIIRLMGVIRPIRGCVLLFQYAPRLSDLGQSVAQRKTIHAPRGL